MLSTAYHAKSEVLDFVLPVKSIKVKVCKDQELKQSVPNSSPQNQNGK